MTPKDSTKPDYGIDAPNVLRNLFLIGLACLGFAAFGPRAIHIGQVDFLPRPMLIGTGTLLLIEALLFLLYVKVGKFYHRDRMLSLHPWRGDEQVLDVGCGRGLLLAGAAKRLAALNGSGLLHAFQQFVKQFFSHGANWFLKNVRHWRILSRLMPACEQEITERKIELFPWLAARITL